MDMEWTLNTTYQPRRSPKITRPATLLNERSGFPMAFPASVTSSEC
jgi:hypothetical protein